MMGTTDIYRASIWEDGDVTELARVEVAGENITQADLTSIIRSIYDLSAGTPTLIATDTITITDAVFDTLQTGNGWTATTGYNFKDRVPGTKFTTGAKTYVVEYAFVGASGELFKVVYQHDIKNIWAS